MAISTLLHLFLVVVVVVESRPPPTDFSRTQGGLQSDQKHAKPDVEGDTSKFEIVGACRANCVEQTLPMEYPPTYDGCGSDQECTTCWQLCEQLFMAEMRFRSRCDDCAGSIGCASACKFSFTSVEMPTTLPWEFENTPVTNEVSNTVLHISWETPRPRPKGKEAMPTGRPFLVYTMLFRDSSNPHWSMVTQTLDHITQVTGPHTEFAGLQFLLIVSSPSGTLAHDIPPYPVIPSTVARATPTTPVPTSKPHQTAEELLPIKPDQVPATMSELSVDVETVNGHIQAVLNWNQEIHTEENLWYTVQWGRISCNVDPTMPHCPLGEESMIDATIPAKDTQQMRLILSQMSYNSKYWLEVGFEGSGDGIKTFFYTPTCPTVDATYTYCGHPKIPVTTTSTVSSTTVQPTTTTSSTTSPPSSTIADDSLRWVQILESLVAEQPSNLPSTTILLCVGVSLGSLVILVLGFMIYRHFCRRPQPNMDLTKVMQSYSELPLLGISHPANSMASLHHIHHHNALAQSILNGSSYGTPTHALATPIDVLTPPVHRAPPTFQQNLGQMNPAASPMWRSMDPIHHTPHPMASSTPSGSMNLCPASVASPVIHDIRHQQQHVLKIKSPAKSRSMEALNKDQTQLSLPNSVSKRSISATDLSPSHSPKPARRSIKFERTDSRSEQEILPTEADPMLNDEQECQRVSSFHASIPPMNLYLHTVPEESELMLSDISDTAIGDDMEWDHESPPYSEESYKERLGAY